MTCHNILLGDGNSWQCLDVSNSAHCHISLRSPEIMIAFLVIIVLLLIGAILLDRHFHKEEIGLLRDIDRTERKILEQLEPRLSFIKIKFQRGKIMAEGPVTLSVGQKTTASIDGFDQNGAPYLGVIPPVTFSIDNSAIASSTPNSDGVTDVVAGISAGVANLTATLTNAAGTKLTDTETVTVTAVVPVLSSIKVSFSAPA
jgi:hypothetical protein